jgi:hypothetical protein
MMHLIRAAGIAVCLALTVQPIRAAEPTTGPSLDQVAVEAYLYLYPLLSIDVTRKQATNVAPGQKLLFGPANMFSNAPMFPPADFKAVVRPKRYALFERFSRHDEGAGNRFRAGHERSILFATHAGYVD